MASVMELDLHNTKKGPRTLAGCRVDRDALSVDGLPACSPDEPVVP